MTLSVLPEQVGRQSESGLIYREGTECLWPVFSCFDCYREGVRRDRYRRAPEATEGVLLRGWAAASYMNVEYLHIAEGLLEGITSSGGESVPDEALSKAHRKLKVLFRIHRKFVGYRRG